VFWQSWELKDRRGKRGEGVDMMVSEAVLLLWSDYRPTRADGSLIYGSWCTGSVITALDTLFTSPTSSAMAFD
jgi:hypothetical protein